MGISYPYFGWLDDLGRELEHDQWDVDKKGEVVSSLKPNSTTSHLSKYHLDNGFLKYKSRIILGPDSRCRYKVFEEHHSTFMAGQ